MAVSSSTCGILTDAILKMLQPSAPASAGAAPFGGVAAAIALHRLKNVTLSAEEKQQAMEVLLTEMERSCCAPPVRYYLAGILNQYPHGVNAARVSAALESCTSRHPMDEFLRALWFGRSGRRAEAEIQLKHVCANHPEASDLLLRFAWDSFSFDPVGMVTWLKVSRKQYGHAFRPEKPNAEQSLFFVLWLCETNRLRAADRFFVSLQEVMSTGREGPLRLALAQAVLKDDMQPVDEVISSLCAAKPPSGGYIKTALGRYWSYINYVFEERVSDPGTLRIARRLADSFHREWQKTAPSIVVAQNMIKCLAASGDGETAVRRLQEMRRTGIDFNLLAAISAQMLWNCRDEHGARSTLDLLIPEENPSTDSLFRVALSQALLGRTAQAEKYLTHLYDCQPDYFSSRPAPLRLQAYLLKSMGHIKAAGEIWNHAVECGCASNGRRAVYERIIPASRPIPLSGLFRVP